MNTLFVFLSYAVHYVCSTTCSSEFACKIVGDNVIDVVTNIPVEDTCQVTCQNTEECVFYTWYDLTTSQPNICILFSTCQVKDVTCSGCYTGPPFCQNNNTTSSTSTITSTLSTTTIATSTTSTCKLKS